MLKVVLNTKPSSPHVSNRVPLKLFYVFLLYRTLGLKEKFADAKSVMTASVL